MSDFKDITLPEAAAPCGVDDAVGVPDAKWHIAIVNNRSEKTVARRLADLGVTAYLPTQQEVRLWKNGRRATVDRVMIPSKVFIRCTEPERRRLVALPFIFRFMTDRAAAMPAGAAHRPFAIVPDHEISRLQFMLGASDRPVTFSERLVKGQLVKVLRGPFKGLTGQILRDPDSAHCRLYINIDFLGSASVEIDAIDVQPL